MNNKIHCQYNNFGYFTQEAYVYSCSSQSSHKSLVKKKSHVHCQSKLINSHSAHEEDYTLDTLECILAFIGQFDRKLYY